MAELKNAFYTAPEFNLTNRNVNRILYKLYSYYILYRQVIYNMNTINMLAILRQSTYQYGIANN